MIHARKDYNEMGARYLAMVHIPQDEPVFLLRATDIIAPTIVRAWAQEHVRLVRDAGSPEDHEPLAAAEEMAASALDHAMLMEQWPNRKLADVGGSVLLKIGIPEVKVAEIPFYNIFDGVLSPLVAGMETKEYNQMLDALCDALGKAFDAAEEVEKPSYTNQAGEPIYGDEEVPGPSVKAS